MIATLPLDVLVTAAIVTLIVQSAATVFLLWRIWEDAVKKTTETSVDSTSHLKIRAGRRTKPCGGNANGGGRKK